MAFHVPLTLICHKLTMPNYRRPRQPGASVFLTVTLAERGAWWLVDHIESLRMAVRRTREERPFRIDAWVVLPDHMHCVWTLPEGDRDFSTRVQVIKARFSRRVPMGHRRLSHVVRRERGLWQRRFWEHHIRNEADFHNHIAYCWHNPVKHGFVERPEDWPFSSWHRDHP
ncbi:REP-associated tyrosine transposase [Sulfitobacter sp. PR48]|uniref:REP-associated tyrosine transposase n=1 Tax=Sulfitobacter sp. PR48 TaxID=3028383 RepID=UPI00237B0F01|nr:transposase [Sulfitobacter sp. PR48]